MLDKLSPKMREVARFTLVGGVCFLVDYGIMVWLKEVFHVDLLIAVGIGFTISVILNYILCVKWVFAAANGSGGQTKALFLTTSLIGLGLTELLMLFFASGLHFHYMLAKVITTLIVMVWNYFTKKMVLERTGNKS